MISGGDGRLLVLVVVGGFGLPLRGSAFSVPLLRFRRLHPACLEVSQSQKVTSFEAVQAFFLSLSRKKSIAFQCSVCPWHLRALHARFSAAQPGLLSRFFRVHPIHLRVAHRHRLRRRLPPFSSLSKGGHSCRQGRRRLGSNRCLLPRSLETYSFDNGSDELFNCRPILC